MYPELTADQLRALEQFAARHGFMWKSQLRALWQMRPEGDGPLFVLRRTHGRAWLKHFRFSQASPPVRRQRAVREKIDRKEALTR